MGRLTKKINTLSQPNFEKIHRNLGCIGFIFLCLFFIHGFFHGDRVPAGGGLGWDGVLYATNACKDPVIIIKEKQLNQYYAARILPSAIVHYGSKLFNFSLGSPIDLENHSVNVISAFYIYNCLLLLLGVWILFLITKEYRWPLSVCFLSFFVVFINYSVLKFSVYYPTLTDISGMVMGLIIFYLYLKDMVFSLVIVSFLASFMWPSIIYSALPLILFKTQKLQLPVFNSTCFSNTLVVLFSIFMVSLTIYLSYSPGSFLSVWIYSTQNTEFLILSAPLMALYIFLGFQKFVDLSYVFSQLKKTNFSRILLACGLLVGVKILVSLISNSAQGPFGTIDYLFFACRYGMLWPLGNVVFHLLDFGPAFLLIIFLWKDFVQIVKERGLGLMLFVYLYTFMSMGSESRQYINAWPVFAILICEVLNRRGVTWSFVYWIAALSLILSRCWLSYNTINLTFTIYYYLLNTEIIKNKMNGVHVICYVAFLLTFFVLVRYVLPCLQTSKDIGILKLTDGLSLKEFTKMNKTLVRNIT